MSHAINHIHLKLIISMIINIKHLILHYYNCGINVRKNSVTPNTVQLLQFFFTKAQDSNFSQ